MGDVIEGEWCEHCALPSVYRVRCVVAPVHDPTQIWWAGWVETCRDCGRQARIKDYGTVGPRPFD